jgi:hypothetical protein
MVETERIILEKSENINSAQRSLERKQQKRQIHRSVSTNFFAPIKKLEFYPLSLRQLPLL